jgi:hypothetical protein
VELLVFIGCLVILDVLALRYGLDSRDGIDVDNAQRQSIWWDDARLRRDRLARVLVSPVRRPHR